MRNVADILEFLVRRAGQEFEMRPLAQKTGVVGGERVDQLDQRVAGRVGQHVPVIFGEGLKTELAQFLSQPRRHQRLFAALQVQAETLVGQVADLAEFLGAEFQPRAFRKCNLIRHGSLRTGLPDRESAPPGRRPESPRPPRPQCAACCRPGS